MAAVPKTIRMPDDIREPIEAEARLARRDFSSVANEMLLEAIKMRRIPGIVFADSRRAAESHESLEPVSKSSNRCRRTERWGAQWQG